MIIDKEIIFNVSNKNKSHLIDKGYDVSCNVVTIRVEDLPTYSHYKIKVKCDVCDNEKYLSYYKYMKNTKLNTKEYCCSQKCATNKLLTTFYEKYGCVSSQHPDIKLKQEQTNIEKYGGKSCQSNKDIKQKSYETMIERYGVKFPFHNKNIKEKFTSKISKTIEKTIKTKIDRGIMVDYYNFSSFSDYRKLVNIETRKNKKELFEKWNGLDYYDTEYIKENLDLNYKDKLFPTVDHKISILYGFKNNIDPFEIGDIKNLCITKRTNNSKKNSKNDLII